MDGARTPADPGKLALYYSIDVALELPRRTRVHEVPWIRHAARPRRWRADARYRRAHDESGHRREYRLDYVIADHKLRCGSPTYEPGGGGINVARAIRRLGARSLALFPKGGPAGVSEVVQAPARGCREPPDALDRVHLGGDQGEHGGGIARARPDFQHAIARAEPRCLGHRGDDVEL
jgi:hypothetical protein